MQFSFLILLMLASMSFAVPTLEARQGNPFTGYQPLTSIFYGGPASYSLDLYADGNTYDTSTPPFCSSKFSSFSWKLGFKADANTDNDLDINLITVNNFDAYDSCSFYTTGQQEVVGTNLDGTIELGPPQPILSVSCKPTPVPPGICLPDYGMCFHFCMVP
jgi:hypothetical protein